MLQSSARYAQDGFCGWNSTEGGDVEAVHAGANRPVKPADQTFCTPYITSLASIDMLPAAALTLVMLLNG